MRLVFVHETGWDTGGESGYAELLSVSLEDLLAPGEPGGLRIRHQMGRISLRWRPGMEEAVLLESPNLADWEPVAFPTCEGLNVVPPGAAVANYYRRDFQP